MKERSICLVKNLAVTVKMVGVGEGLPIRSINKADEVAGKCFARNCTIFVELIRKSSFLANDAKQPLSSVAFEGDALAGVEVLSEFLLLISQRIRMRLKQMYLKDIVHCVSMS